MPLEIEVAQSAVAPAAAARHSSATQRAEPRARAARRQRRTAARAEAYAGSDIELVLEGERRRMAADVHDLVMQDLSFALARARAIAEDPVRAWDDARAVVSAGERALAGARRLLESLDNVERLPVRLAVEEAVRTAARGAALRFESSMTDEDRADRLTMAALIHVAREAVTNAIKHAEPTRIAVLLARERAWLLVVTDNGTGSDPDPADGFGLASMRRQAELLGGRLTMLCEPGAGSVVELVLP